VRPHDLRLGTVTGVVFDAGRECVLGLEATGRDGVRRFLPWVAVELAGNAADRLAAGSRRHGELDGYARLCAVVVRDPLQLAGVPNRVANSSWPSACSTTAPGGAAAGHAGQSGRSAKREVRGSSPVMMCRAELGCGSGREIQMWWDPCGVPVSEAPHFAPRTSHLLS
jgi:hypothetical protein